MIYQSTSILFKVDHHFSKQHDRNTQCCALAVPKGPKGPILFFISLPQGALYSSVLFPPLIDSD